MPTEYKNRVLHIYRYLWENTDEDHPAFTSDIIRYLKSLGIDAGSKTISRDIDELTGCGYDIIRIRSRQNQYFVGARDLQLPELKMLVDAVQAAKFITADKSRQLIEKLVSMAGPKYAHELNRQLYMDGRAKTENKGVYYTIDLLYSAISSDLQVRFKYYEYSPTKKLQFKHNGQIYCFSPYDLVWSNDNYYAVGFSESHNKVVKFRVDRIYRPVLSEKESHPKPADYHIELYCRRVFSMFDAEECTVELLCENSLMKSVVDRFGSDVPTKTMDCGHFRASVTVAASPTFFAWVSTFEGRIRIVSPKYIVERYREHLEKSLQSV